jgi:hypothetical protein
MKENENQMKKIENLIKKNWNKKWKKTLRSPPVAMVLVLMYTTVLL